MMTAIRVFGQVAVAAALSVLCNWALSPSFPVHTVGAVVVTGASSGIGFDAAVALAKVGGLTVFAGVRKAADAAAISALAIPALIPLQIEVTSPESVARAAAQVEQWLTANNQGLVGLVNNAGVSTSLPVEAMPISSYKDMHEVNVVGVLIVSQAFLPLIRASKGRVVNIGSVAGLVSFPVHGLYAATKMALEGITDAMRRELALFDVSVSMVNPGAVTTKIVEKAQTANEELLGALSPALTVAYANLTKAYMKARTQTFASASSTDVTSSAIIHALTAPSPQARYVVATVTGLPASVYAAIVWYLPTRLTDRIIYNALAKYM